ncbi:PREDICTED: C-type lectin domain family 7 member A [Condylura cristata]|uniref:C-type lectin domain family 7 member A n=1 Tax=Condylura cristata TaxID=143302 RepID=UPI000643639A|nr:PREDICTED: C-type lectin domain family 7 member A [Condylura cristata]
MMDNQPQLGNLDEDGYTQLDFSSRNITRPVLSKKGFYAISLRWRVIIAVTLGVLCVVILVTAAVLSTMASSSCPPSWITHENSCYLLSTPLTSWNKSRNHCLKLGSHLLKIDSSGELKFIEEQVSSQPYHSFWIGLSRHQDNGPWLWEDGSEVSPNLFQVTSTETQEKIAHNCVWIHESIFYDQLCNVSSLSICEKRLSK